MEVEFLRPQISKESVTFKIGQVRGITGNSQLARYYFVESCAFNSIRSLSLIHSRLRNQSEQS